MWHVYSDISVELNSVHAKHLLQTKKKPLPRKHEEQVTLKSFYKLENTI